MFSYKGKANIFERNNVWNKEEQNNVCERTVNEDTKTQQESTIRHRQQEQVD
jgi:hypothetical protein